jgi:hypothetical protein
MTAPKRPKRLPNGSAEDFARDSAILLSIAIAHGADVDMISDALRQGRAHGRRLAKQSPLNETETPSSAA